MDSMHPVVSKKPITAVNVSPSTQVVECIRPFKLTQQFPSKVSVVQSKSLENLVVQSKNSLNMVPLMPIITDMGVTPVVKTISPAMFQKLKLKLPDGKDLGEFKVQVLSQRPDLTQGKTITLPNHGTLTRIDNPSALSLLKATDTNTTRKGDLQMTTPLGNSINMSIADKNTNTGLNQLRISPKNFTLHNIVEHQEGKRKTRVGILRSTKEKEKINQAQQDKNKVLVIPSQTHSEIPQLQIQPNNVNVFQLPATHKVIILQANGNTTAIKPNSNLGFAQLKTVAPSTGVVSPTQNVINRKCSQQNKRNYTESIAATSFDINSSKSYQHDSHDTKPIITVQKNKNGKLIHRRIVKLPDYHKVRIPRLNKKVNEEVSSTTVNKAVQHTLSVTLPSNSKKIAQYGCNNVVIKRCDQISSSSSKNTCNEICIMRQPVRLVDPPTVQRENTLNIEKNKNVGANAPNPINSSTVDTTVRDNCIPEKNNFPLDTVQMLQNNTAAEKKNAVEKTNIFEDSVKDQPESTMIIPDQNENNGSISSNLNILKEALGSVTDVDLRAKALKALAECGLKFEREIPIQPSHKTITYGDTDTQTEIFGLIDPQQFILASEDFPDLKRISTQTKCIQKSGLGRMSISEKSIQFLNDDCVSISPDNSLFLPDIEMENLLHLNKCSSKIIDLFDKPSVSVERIYKQMKRDFMDAIEWDENGMLGIHKSVLNGALNEIKRQLIVLQACKMDVDIPTRNGETSLELAVLHDIDASIVKLFLRTGAKPVSSIPLHDSAITIASKLSLPILSDLIAFVKTPQLLNNLDSQVSSI
ncbi:uncharacterized protein LOC107270695 isoform X2 [Cephus cinctus]|uniref:Uncharacterized protein LOC107270695 isoform X2 n=1 Tax=Cephus cinctus TaxID=211228 RepID=A0AAJ7FP54_CEPCN|nr:uncharacterized protein LOC107270695 isoform X2 [Cephus cinctus]